MALVCPVCAFTLVGPHNDFKIPAWCPRCGADPKTPTRGQRLSDRAEDEKWDEKWGRRQARAGDRGEAPPTPPPAAEPQPAPSPAVTLRPRVSLVPQAAAQEQGTGELLTEEPIPVLHPVRDEEVPVLERADDPRPPSAALRGPTPSTCLTHFHVRVTSFWNWSTTIHRVYVAGNDLLFVHLGVVSLDPEDAGRRTAASMGGGLIPALIGTFSAMRAREELKRLTKALEAADEDVLRQFIREDQQSFLLSVAEIGNVCIEAPSIWRKMFSNGCSALLTWDHATRGPMKMELLDIRDVGTAIPEAQRLFGPSVRVNVSWNSL
jgi:hypothetical protein